MLFSSFSVIMYIVLVYFLLHLLYDVFCGSGYKETNCKWIVLKEINPLHVNERHTHLLSVMYKGRVMHVFKMLKIDLEKGYNTADIQSHTLYIKFFFFSYSCWIFNYILVLMVHYIFENEHYTPPSRVDLFSSIFIL